MHGNIFYLIIFVTDVFYDQEAEDIYFRKSKPMKLRVGYPLNREYLRYELTPEADISRPIYWEIPIRNFK